MPSSAEPRFTTGVVLALCGKTGGQPAKPPSHVRARCTSSPFGVLSRYLVSCYFWPLAFTLFAKYPSADRINLLEVVRA